MIITWFNSVSLNMVMPESAVQRISQLIEFNGCTMTAIKVYTSGLAGIYGVTGKPAAMSSLFKALEELEWDTPDKIYIFPVHKKKRSGKNGKALGGKADEGSQGGAVEGADPDPEHGQGSGVGGTGDSAGVPGDGDHPGVPETDAADDHRDQQLYSRDEEMMRRNELC